MGDCVVPFVERCVYSYMAHVQHKGKNKVPYAVKEGLWKCFKQPLHDWLG